MRSFIDQHAPAARRANGALHVEGHITRERSRYRLALHVRSRSGDAWRSVDADECTGMAEVAALLVAMSLDPRSDGLEDGPTPQTAQPDSSAPGKPTEAATSEQQASESVRPKASAIPTTSALEASPAPAAIAIEEPPSIASDPQRISLAMGASASVEDGMLSAVPGVGLEPQFELRYGVLRAGASVGLWIAGQKSVEEYPRAAVASRAWVGQLSLGIDLFESALTLLPRAVFERGVIFLKASGITDSASDDAAWTAAGGGAQINYTLAEGFEVAFTVLVLAPFSRPRARITTDAGAREVFSSARVSGRLSLGLHYVIY